MKAGSTGIGHRYNPINPKSTLIQKICFWKSRPGAPGTQATATPFFVAAQISDFGTALGPLSNTMSPPLKVLAKVKEMSDGQSLRSMGAASEREAMITVMTLKNYEILTYPQHFDVNHPKHYNKGKIEVIDAIEDWELSFCDGNVIKYVARHRHKGKPIEDLKKAKWYLERLIQQYEQQKPS